MQKQMLQRSLAGAFAGTFLAATVMFASAAGPSRDTTPGAAPAQVQPDLTQISNQKLVLTAFQGDSARVALAAGFSNIGAPTSIDCGHACVVEVQTMVQVEETNAYWAICPTIDGVDAVQGCGWQGIASNSAAVYVTGNGTYFWSLAPGHHTLQPQIYLSVDGALDNWGLTLTKYNTLNK